MSKKEFIGKIISDKMDKTRVVEVVHVYRHPLYRKVVHKKHKYYAHDEDNATHEGDTVKIVEFRPLSKTKRWQVLEILKTAEGFGG